MPLPRPAVPTIVTNRTVPRRALLQGAGAALALPLLDAMLPAVSLAAPPAKVSAAPCRMAFLYVPNGIMMEHWIPDQKPGAVTPLPSVSPPSPPPLPRTARTFSSSAVSPRTEAAPSAMVPVIMAVPGRAI